jgi:hypothetical protein
MSNAIIDSISPTEGPASGGTRLTINGSGLTGATTVIFSGGVNTSFNVESGGDDTQITVLTLPAPHPGTADVQVNVPSGPSPKAPIPFTFLPVTPVITSISPTTGPNTGGTQLTITGENLAGATAVNFANVGALPPINSTATEITVTTPAVPSGTVPVTVVTAQGTSPLTAAAQFTFTDPPVVNALFAIKNQTGVPDELVFVKFLGAQINANSIPQTFGKGSALQTGGDTASRSYSLKEMTAPLPNGPAGEELPMFQLNDYRGGRIYFSLAKALDSTTIPDSGNSADTDFHKVYGFVEPSIFPAASDGQTNIDASYVDFVGLPTSIAILNRADNQPAPVPSGNNPLFTRPGPELFPPLVKVAPGAVVAANTVAVTESHQTVTIGGTARILSPSASRGAGYHDWSGLLSKLRESGAQLRVESCRVQDANGPIKPNVLFGFSTVTNGTSPMSPEWLKEQDYRATAIAVSELTPNPPVAGVSGPGIQITGHAGIVGDFTIYITDAALEDSKGIYGADPASTVQWNGQTFTLVGSVNDLSGRIIGDLLAGINFGWALASDTVAAKAQANGLSHNLVNTVFASDLANTPIGQLSTGEFFYLLSLQQSTAEVAAWFGSNLQTTSDFYNTYSSAFQSLTAAYNMAYTDRLQSNVNPDIFFTPSEDTYVEITLLPGAYTVTIT